MKTIHAVIRGRVQGVGFRFFVMREAASRDIKGFVRNMEGGEGVEVVASGDASAVAGFVGMLWTGPQGAEVTDVTTHHVETAPVYSDFTIHH